MLAINPVSKWIMDPVESLHRLSVKAFQESTDINQGESRKQACFHLLKQIKNLKEREKFLQLYPYLPLTIFFTLGVHPKAAAIKKELKLAEKRMAEGAKANAVNLMDSKEDVLEDQEEDSGGLLDIDENDCSISVKFPEAKDLAKAANDVYVNLLATISSNHEDIYDSIASGDAVGAMLTLHESGNAMDYMTGYRAMIKFLIGDLPLQKRFQLSDDMQSYISRIQRLAKEAAQHGWQVDGKLIILAVICGLPDTFDDYLNLWLSTSSKSLESLGLPKVTSALVGFHKRLMSTTRKSVSSAKATESTPTRNAPSTSGAYTKVDRPVHSAYVCKGCGKKGHHWMHKCPIVLHHGGGTKVCFKCTTPDKIKLHNFR
jgi:hypothetical protein